MKRGKGDLVRGLRPEAEFLWRMETHSGGNLLPSRLLKGGIGGRGSSRPCLEGFQSKSQENYEKRRGPVTYPSNNTTHKPEGAVCPLLKLRKTVKLFREKNMAERPEHSKWGKILEAKNQKGEACEKSTSRNENDSSAAATREQTTSERRRNLELRAGAIGLKENGRIAPVRFTSRKS